MTRELRAAWTDRLSLLDKLQAAVRPEFAVELIHTDPAHPVFARGQCRVAGCERGAWSKFLCNGHYGRWTREGRPQLATFAMTTGPMAGHSDRIDAFDLRGLPLQLRLGVAYSIQIRHDQRTIRLVPMMINRLVRLVIAAKVGSLLDHGLERWTLLAHKHGLTDTGGRAMGQLRFAWRHVLDLAEGIDAEAEFARDTWRATALGARPSPKKVPPIRFDHIPQPWLREPVKRACRYRLAPARRSARSASTSARCAGSPHSCITITRKSTLPVGSAEMSWSTTCPGSARHLSCRGTRRIPTWSSCAASCRPATATTGCPACPATRRCTWTSCRLGRVPCHGSSPSS